MKTVGQAVLNWGTKNETWGYAENLTAADESEKKPIQDGDGDTTGVIYSDIRKKVSAEYTPLAGAATQPASQADIIGSKLTLKTEGDETIEILVDGAEKKYTKGDVTTWSVNGYYYPNLAAQA